MFLNKTAVWTFIFAVITMAYVTLGAVPFACQQCLKGGTCLPPDCFCCRDDLSLPNITLSQIPQMVFFTFDDAVTSQAAGFYKQLFASSRKNPNGCPISMTLFISHDNTQYRLVSEFHNLGMEIASHSVTHSTMNGTNFLQEAKSQKENLAKLAGVPIDEITGWRSPFLKPTGDLQPDALKKLGYKYDATLTFSKRSFREKPPGPFTLDFGYPYECQVKPCPKHRHPGFWEIPVVSLMDYKQAYDCVYVDGCMNAPPDEESAYKFLWDNFHNYYTTTKMPFGINMHPSWFYYPDRLKAMDRFIQKLVSLNDVYIISVNRVLEWLKRPTPLQDLHSFAPWACDGSEKTFNTGPRLVKTNLPPPPVPRSFIQWSNGPRVVHTPAPATKPKQRAFTKTRLFTPQKSSEVNNNQLPGLQNPLFTVDLSNDVPSTRRQVDTLRRHLGSRLRPNTASSTRTLHDPPNSRRVTRLRRPEMVQTPALPPLSQRERLEQHEERMRQRRIFEEQQRQKELLQRRQQQQKRQEELRQQELLKQRQQQQKHHELIQQQRQQELAKQQAAQTSQIQGTGVRGQGDTSASNRILWAPSVMSTDISSEIISKVDNHRAWSPTNIQQETVKVWPPRAFRSRFGSRRPNTNPRPSLIQSIQTTRVTPAPIPTHSRGNIRFTESPRHVWYADMFTRFGPLANAPQIRRGGSNRRLGIRDPTISIRVTDRSSSQQRRLQPQRLMLTNNTVVRQRDRPEPLRERRLGQPRQALMTVRSRNRSPAGPMDVRAAQSDTGFGRRNVLHPTVAQQLAWNSFIRKMLGPH